MAGYGRGVSLAVVFLPDTALVVPGAGGRLDPAAGLREAALARLVGLPGLLGGGEGRVLVVAPGRRDRVLPHPVAPGLGAAGLLLPAEVGGTPGTPGRRAATPDTSGPGGPAVRADVPASAALVLLGAAGVTAPVDVVEIDRAAAAAPPVVPADGLRAVVVVGSLSARHGPDAPLAEDPRAPAVDADLLAALGGGPDDLRRVLAALGPDAARELAVSGWAPWQVALALLPADAAVDAVAPHAEEVAGARHVVAAWWPRAAREPGAGDAERDDAGRHGAAVHDPAPRDGGPHDPAAHDAGPHDAAPHDPGPHDAAPRGPVPHDPEEPR